jgi:hypothetical protein
VKDADGERARADGRCGAGQEAEAAAMSGSGSGRPPARGLKTLARPPCRNALIIIAIAAAMVGLFAASYSLALGRARPHHITVGIIRTAVYFRSRQHFEPFAVLAGWLACTLAALLISARLLRRRPAGQ